MRILGYARPSELIGKRVLDDIHPDDDHTLAGTRLATHAAQNSGDTIELRKPAKDGSVVPLDCPRGAVPLR